MTKIRKPKLKASSTEQPTRVNDGRASVRALERRGHEVSYRIIRSVFGRFKVIATPWGLLVGLYETEDEARDYIKEVMDANPT